MTQPFDELRRNGTPDCRRLLNDANAQQTRGRGNVRVVRRREDQIEGDDRAMLIIDGGTVMMFVRVEIDDVRLRVSVSDEFVASVRSRRFMNMLGRDDRQNGDRGTEHERNGTARQHGRHAM